MWPNRGQGKKTSFGRPTSDETSLERTLRAWGVDPDRNDNHQDFWNACMEYIRNVLDGMIEMKPINSPQLLSPKITVAVQEVMRQELTTIHRKGNLMIEVTDRWKELYPNLRFGLTPFEFDRHDRKYRLKPELQYLGIQVNTADPFQRFTYERVDSKQLLKKQIYESIRWNGYEHADTQEDVQFHYWKKLVCINGRSVYEIKTAESLEQIEEKLNGGIVNGGNFYSSYHAIQNELLSSHKHDGMGGARRPRQYVAVLSLETTTEGNTKKRCWPVHVAEVKCVGPQLKNRSLCHDSNTSVKIYSRMHFEEGAGQFWFNVPYVEMDGKPIAAAIIETLP